MRTLLNTFVLLLVVGCADNTTQQHEEVVVVDTLTDVAYRDLSAEQLHAIDEFWAEYKQALVVKDIRYIADKATFPLDGGWNHYVDSDDTSNTKLHFEQDYDKLFGEITDSIKSKTGYSFTEIQQNQFGEIKSFRVMFVMYYFNELDPEDFTDSAVILSFVRKEDSFMLNGYFIAG